MARHRKVTEDTAIEAAKVAFWQHGYQGLGTRQLESETGITRFSLQTVYGGKMALFERALDAYLEDMQTFLLPTMADGTLDGLAQWFETRCDPGSMPPAGKWGCLMIASIGEFGDGSLQVSSRALRFEAMLRGAFSDALRQIAERGDLPKRFDQAAATEMLIAASIGLNVMIRAGGDCTAGLPIATGIATMIRGWGPMR